MLPKTVKFNHTSEMGQYHAVINCSMQMLRSLGCQIRFQNQTPTWHPSPTHALTHTHTHTHTHTDVWLYVCTLRTYVLVNSVKKLLETDLVTFVLEYFLKVYFTLKNILIWHIFFLYDFNVLISRIKNKFKKTILIYF